MTKDLVSIIIPSRKYLEVRFNNRDVDRIFSKIIIDMETGCLNWIGNKDGQGYGLLKYNGKTERIHRLMYANFIGSVPRGLNARKNKQLDHKCKNKSCCNPSHLELVTQRENIIRGDGPSAINARKTHCNKGHIFPTDKNRRYCKVCDSIRHSERIRGENREYWLEKQRINSKNYRERNSL